MPGKEAATAEVYQLTNPATGRPYSTSNPSLPAKLKPKYEHAIVMYSLGKLASLEAASAVAGISKVRFSVLLNSPAGQAVVERVRKELDFRYQALQKKFIDVVEQALDHPDPAVALAGASLFAKTQIGTKVKVELSAEDVVQQLMQGTYEVSK